MQAAAERAREGAEQAKRDKATGEEMMRVHAEQRLAQEEEQAGWRALKEGAQARDIQQAMLRALGEVAAQRARQEQQRRRRRRAGAEEAQPEATVWLLVRDKARARVMPFQAQRGRPLISMMHAAARQWHLQEAGVQWLRAGRPVSPLDTAEQLGLSDEDVIDVEVADEKTALADKAKAKAEAIAKKVAEEKAKAKAGAKKRAVEEAAKAKAAAKKKAEEEAAAKATEEKAAKAEAAAKKKAEEEAAKKAAEEQAAAKKRAEEEAAKRAAEEAARKWAEEEEAAAKRAEEEAANKAAEEKAIAEAAAKKRAEEEAAKESAEEVSALAQRSRQIAPAPPPKTWDAYAEKSEESARMIRMVDLLIEDLDKAKEMTAEEKAALDGAVAALVARLGDARQQRPRVEEASVQLQAATSS